MAEVEAGIVLFPTSSSLVGCHPSAPQHTVRDTASVDGTDGIDGANSLDGIDGVDDADSIIHNHYTSIMTYREVQGGY